MDNSNENSSSPQESTTPQTTPAFNLEGLSLIVLTSVIEGVIKAMAADGRLQNLLDIKEVNNKKKVGMTYYTDVCGREMKAIVDQLIQQGEDKPIFFLYRDYGHKPDTLYKKLTQGINYLVDHLDTEDKLYGNLWESDKLQITNKLSKEGYAIVIKSKVDNKNVPLIPRNVTPEELTALNPKWRMEMDDWLTESKPGEMMKWTGMGLTDSEVKELKVELGQLQGLLFTVTNNKLIIAKQPKEEDKQQ